MRVVFRTDASEQIGIGHVMRCLTLAEVLQNEDVVIKFICRKNVGNKNDYISKKGFQVIELLSNSEKQDANDTILCLNNLCPQWIIVDHYELGKKWEDLVRPYVRNIMVIDDLANRQHNCDLLLDQNWFENLEKRYDKLLPGDTIKLLGPKYALLRLEFSQTRKSLNDKSKTFNGVFIFFGGYDPFNLTELTISALTDPELLHLDIHVVIGQDNKHKDEILKLVNARLKSYLYSEVDNMASIMSKTDFAIGAGGVNTWERMCLGLPTLVISFAENHDIILDDLSNNGYVNFIGNGRELCKADIKKGILDLIKDEAHLHYQREQIIKLVDGNGAKIVSDYLVGNLSNRKWKIESTKSEYSSLYWFWANDEQVRNNSLNRQKISLDEHIVWYNNKLKDKNCSMYVIFSDEIPVGQVRFDKEKYFARIDYSIAKQFRGRKLGKFILGFAIEKFRKTNSIDILGEVIHDNIVSAKVFELLGFKLSNRQKNKVYIKDSTPIQRY